MTAKATALSPKPADPRPLPPTPPLTRGVARLADGAALHWWDSGCGVPLIINHAHSGTGEDWGHQIGPLSAAGYRVIGWTRRGYAPSTRGTGPGTQGGDLAAVCTACGLAGGLHLLGLAAGGMTALDFALDCALAEPGRIAHLTLCNSLMGLAEPDWQIALRAAQPPDLPRLPPEARELSPGFRARFPLETAAFATRVRQAEARGDGEPPQPVTHRARMDDLARFGARLTLITGAHDLYLPPAVLRGLAPHLPLAQIEILPDAAHLAPFETPDAFNALMIGHLASPKPSGAR